MVFNVSNLFVELDPVVRGLAEALGFEVVCVTSPADGSRELYVSTWCVLTRNREFLDHPSVREARTEFPAGDRPPIVWTDDFSSLWSVLSRHWHWRPLWHEDAPLPDEELPGEPK